MANPGNLLRTPILNNAGNNPPIPQAPLPPTPQINRDAIEQIVEDMLRARLNVDQSIEIVDQGNDEKHLDLTDLDRVPDIVKCLRVQGGP